MQTKLTAAFLATPEGPEAETILRSCETTCPSGVSYGRLIDIGRELVEERVQRPALVRLKRTLLRRVLPFPTRFSALLGLGRAVRPLLPKPLAKKIPPRQRLRRHGQGLRPFARL